MAAEGVNYWDKDRCTKAPCNCGKSSMELLIEWLSYTTSEGYANLIRWRGGSKKKDGKNKLTIAGMIVQMLQDEHGLHRTAKSVKGKIEEFHAKANKVSDFDRQTGEGSTDPKETIDVRPTQAFFVWLTLITM
jgi:hypothetical protein